MSSPREDLLEQVDRVEEAYEYFLAYAGQGLESDGGGGAGGEIRDWLERMNQALDILPGLLSTLLEEEAPDPAVEWQELKELMGQDARAARTKVRLVASRPVVSSQLVDNLNASMHLRALLTDLFILDGLLKADGVVAQARS